MDPIDNDRWERLAEPLVLSPEEVSARIRVAFPEAEVVASERIPSGLANTNMRVRLRRPDREVLLRIHQRDPESAAKEAALVARVAGLVPVAEVLHHQPARAGEASFSLLRFVPGRLLARVLESGSPGECEAAGRAAGGALAALASVRFPVPGELGADLVPRAFPFAPQATASAFPAMLLSEPMVREAIGADRCREIARLLAAWEGRFPEDEGILCHADFKGSNLLLEPDGTRLAAVLDWEFAFSGPLRFDFAALLRWDHVLPPRFIAGVLAGYRDGGGRLPPGSRPIVKLHDLGNLLSMLVGAPPGSRRRSDLVALVDLTLAVIADPAPPW